MFLSLTSPLLPRAMLSFRLTHEHIDNNSQMTRRWTWKKINFFSSLLSPECGRLSPPTFFDEKYKKKKKFWQKNKRKAAKISHHRTLIHSHGEREFSFVIFRKKITCLGVALAEMQSERDTTNSYSNCTHSISVLCWKFHEFVCAWS